MRYLLTFALNSLSRGFMPRPGESRTRSARPTRVANCRAPRLLSALIKTAATATLFCSLWVVAAAQRTVPETITLRTGFVGVPYELPLNSLLPTGAPELKWSGPICQGEEKGELECPKGVTVDSEGKKLVVKPKASDLDMDGMPKTYTFEVAGTDDAGVNLRLRFELEVKPLGIDASRFENNGDAGGDRRYREEDEVRRLVVNVAPPRRIAKAVSAPTPEREPFVLVKSTADEETIALTEDLKSDLIPAKPKNKKDEKDCVICYDDSDRTNFYIANADVGPLLKDTIMTDKSVTFQTGDYLVLHIVKWKQLKEDKSDPDRELWALFEKIKPRTIDGHSYEWLPHFAATEKGTMMQKRLYDTRIYGSKRVFILPIHVNTPPTWDIKYKLAVSQQVPTPIQNAMQLAAAISGGNGPREALAAPPPKNIWGARLMLVRYAASDMLVHVNAISPSNSFQIKEQNKDYAKKYDNEGRYWWDVSVGLPANSIKELTYNVDTTGQNSVVSVKKVERQNAYGFLNLFPRPVDLEANSFLTKPHLVLGVPISGKPLDRPIVAVGTGIYRDLFKINFFAGVAFNKVREPRTLQVGDPATEGQLETDIRTRRQAKFVFGINFPVRQFLQAIKSDKK